MEKKRKEKEEEEEEKKGTRVFDLRDVKERKKKSAAPGDKL